MFNIDRRYLLAALLLVAVIVFSAGAKYGEMKQTDMTKESLVTEADTEKKATVAGDEIQVYVCGEVEKPGLYKLAAGARVYDALKLAGILPGAALDYAQPARPLQDGETVELLSEAEIVEQAIGNNNTPAADTVSVMPASSQPSATGGLVNINTATVQELDERLPGVGPAIAQRIVDYRESNGSYAKIEDIQNVSGIGDKKYADLKDLISVR
ncbi:MAG: competence protein ComEA helix-hairpin-helix region [Firmicutes bacterium]|nr:competence protein ComEA helix-hairpin-helix region [Bacillota bacterium]